MRVGNSDRSIRRREYATGIYQSEGMIFFLNNIIHRAGQCECLQAESRPTQHLPEDLQVWSHQPEKKKALR